VLKRFASKGVAHPNPAWRWLDGAGGTKMGGPAPKGTGSKDEGPRSLGGELSLPGGMKIKDPPPVQVKIIDN
jgi:hypothetical protein